MNGRIRELAQQAELNATLLFNKEKLEKFAELIVRECIDQCEEIAVGADKIANDQFVTDAGRMLHQGMWGGAKNCSAQIKEHFGIQDHE